MSVNASVYLRPKLNLVDVEYLRNNVDLLFEQPSPPSKPQGKDVSPKKKNAKLKDKKVAGKKKVTKKKGQDEEDAGKLLKQKKDMYKNYLDACSKIQVEPLKHIVNLFSMQEQVDWTAEEREAMNAPVTAIVLQDQHVGPGGTRAVCAALAGRWVAGSGNVFGPEYGILESLQMKRCAIGAMGAEAIASMLEVRSCGLKKLYLYRCGIREQGAASLGRALRFGYNRSLVELRLDGDETMGDDGVTQLCSALSTNSTLKSLSLGSCGIGPVAAKALGDLLKCRRCMLDHLGLEVNNLGDKGLRLLCEGLCRLRVKERISSKLEEVDRFCQLKALDIASISVDANKKNGYSGIEALGRVILENPHIRTIDFNANMFDDYAGNLLHSALSNAKRRRKSVLKNFIVSSELPGNLFHLLYLDETTSRSFEEVPLATLFDEAMRMDSSAETFRVRAVGLGGGFTTPGRSSMLNKEHQSLPQVGRK